MLLLITACINVSDEIPFTELKNSSERFRLLINTLDWAIQQKVFDKITVCESSNYRGFDFKQYVFEKNKVVQFEYITFCGNTDKVIKYGKGYGEGEILERFCAESKLFKDETVFCKLTSKLYIDNLDKLKLNKRKCTCFQEYMTFDDMVDTRFFVMEKSIFQKYFLNVYQEVNDEKKHFLEHVYYDVLKRNKIVYKSFRQFPIIRGKSGTSNKDYRGTRGNWIVNAMCFFNLINHPFFKKIGKKNLK